MHMYRIGPHAKQYCFLYEIKKNFNSFAHVNQNFGPALREIERERKKRRKHEEEATFGTHILGMNLKEVGVQGGNHKLLQISEIPLLCEKIF